MIAAVRVGVAALALSACLPTLELAPCYSDADCASGQACQSATCVPAGDAGTDVPATCTVEPSTRVRTVAYPYTGDRVPPAALAFDGERYWALVEDVVPDAEPRFELYTVKLDARGERVAGQASDPVVRGRSTGQPVAPFLMRGPSGLVAGWNERASAADAYLGYAGALGADGVVRTPAAFEGRLEEVVLDGASTFGALTLDVAGVGGLQQLGTSSAARVDPALFAVSAARAPTGDWLLVAERADDVDVVRLSGELVERDTHRLVDGSDGEASAPRALWTGDAMTVLFSKITAAGPVVHVLEADAEGEVTEPAVALTGTVAGLPAMAYSAARDELAVAYARGPRVEVVRISRRTGARTVHPLGTAGVTAIEPTVLAAGPEYAVAWLEEDMLAGYVLRMSRIVCR